MEEGQDLGPPFVGNHAQCLVYFADRTGGDYDECTPVFPGRPVAVPMQWVSSRFGDQWDHALKCPNMPVLVSPRRDRFPVVSPRVACLLDVELLLQLHKEDIATSVKRRLTSRTPPSRSARAEPCSGVSVPGEGSVSLLWGVLPTRAPSCLENGCSDLNFFCPTRDPPVLSLCPSPPPPAPTGAP
jgi:hypothetical protein